MNCFLAAGKILPHGRNAPQVVHNAGNFLQDVVHVLLGVPFAQAQPQGAVGDLVGGGRWPAAHGWGPENRRCRRCRRTHRSRPDPTATAGFRPSMPLKAEVHVAGEPVDGIAVQGAVGNLRETSDKLVPQCGDLGGVFIDVIAGLLQRSGQAHNAGGRFPYRPACPAPGRRPR